MSDSEQLQYLIDLIDDDATEVREQIMGELSKYGLKLEEDLKEFSELLSKDRLEILKPILSENRRKWLRRNWYSWNKIPIDLEGLEEAMNLIAKFHFGFSESVNLHFELDRLSEEFKNKYPYGNEIDLAKFLFQEKNLQGEKVNYYYPLNSNLIYVIEKKKGIPISLALIYIFTGYRLGMKVEGCNFPGHFLAKINVENETIFIDCFNGGNLIYESEIYELVDAPSDSIERMINMPINSNVLIKRVLNNLINAYHHYKDDVNEEFFRTLLESSKF